MVLQDYAGKDRGHVAVVQSVVSAREVRVDHANWLNDGGVLRANPVMDVSSANDWSQVRVWNMQTGAWGARIYPVQGFISVNDAAPPQDDGIGAILEQQLAEPNPPAGSPYALTEEDRRIGL